MKNLGKILLLIFLFPFTLLADIRASVDSTAVEVGEMVTYNLTISGEDIEKPNINSLCDSDIIATGSQTSVEIVNGNYKKNYILSYKFSPQKSCVIEPVELEIDGIKQKSNSVELKVSAVVASKDSEFKLSISSDKKDVFVGESFEMTLLLKQKKGAAAVDSKFVPPTMTGFWVKGEQQPTKYEEGDYIVTKVVYNLAAQREGILKIEKSQLRIATRSHTRDSWGSWVPKIKWKTYFSNDLSIDVKPLPQGVKLIGDFSISATVDTAQIDTNEAVNVDINVNGIGNLEDIKSFKPIIKGVSVFDEKISINKNLLTQKLAFVGEEDFVIPPFTLKYFDTNTKEIKTISTKEIQIKVNHQKKKEQLVIKREEKKLVSEEENRRFDSFASSYYSFVFVMIGFVFGILVMILSPWRYFKSQKNSKISLKEPKKLLVKLLPYQDDSEVQELIDILENNIYSSTKKEIDKKKIKEIIGKYNIV